VTLVAGVCIRYIETLRALSFKVRFRSNVFNLFKMNHANVSRVTWCLISIVIFPFKANNLTPLFSVNKGLVLSNHVAPLARLASNEKNALPERYIFLKLCPRSSIYWRPGLWEEWFILQFCLILIAVPNDTSAHWSLKLDYEFLLLFNLSAIFYSVMI